MQPGRPEDYLKQLAEVFLQRLMEDVMKGTDHLHRGTRFSIAALHKINPGDKDAIHIFAGGQMAAVKITVTTTSGALGFEHLEKATVAAAQALAKYFGQRYTSKYSMQKQVLVSLLSLPHSIIIMLYFLPQTFLCLLVGVWLDKCLDQTNTQFGLAGGLAFPLLTTLLLIQQLPEGKRGTTNPNSSNFPLHSSPMP